ncbi:MAG: protease modulator HflK [Pirellulaceae bacterium]|jgi:membrane protease subunit HflK|nr:protease modulator HflK [Pirellulaceae bacterium]
MNPAREKTLPTVFQGLQSGLRMFRWVMLLLFVLFWFSGIQEVEPDQVGLLLRFGKLQGANRAAQVHEPGLLLALPYPIDRVIQVPAKQEGEVLIKEVWKGIEETGARDRIDPVLEGYCLTGDQNIVQAQVVVKYRIRDPVSFRLATADPPAVLHDVVLAALTQTVTGWNVNDVLRLQRQDPERPGQTEGLADSVRDRAQQRLDRLDCGIAISALEFKQLHPPRHVIAEFRDVQSAQIDVETKQREAEGFAFRETPKADAERNRLIQSAAADRNTLHARAMEEYSVFEQLYSEYQKHPELVRNRIYLETVEDVLASVGKLDFVSPDDRVILDE